MPAPGRSSVLATLINKNIAANNVTAGRVPVTEVDRKEVVGTGVTVVGHIDSETDLCLTNLADAGDVGLITVEGEGGDLGGAKRDSGNRVIISKVTVDHGLFLRRLEPHVKLEIGEPAVRSNNRAGAIDVVW